MTIKKKTNKDKKRRGYIYEVRVDYSRSDGTRGKRVKTFESLQEAKFNESLWLFISCSEHDLTDELIELYENRLNSNESEEYTNQVEEVPAQPTCTLRTMYNRWLEVVAPTLAPNTKHDVMKCFGFCDSIADMDIKEVNVDVLLKFFNDRSDKGYEMNKSIKKTLNRLFKLALEFDYITKNPIDSQMLRKLPGTKRPKETKVYTIKYDDFVRLTDSLDSMDFLYQSYSIFNWIGYFAGLRMAETVALTKDDIDLEANTIRVNKQLQYKGLKKDTFYTRDTKTEASNALVPITDVLRDKLVKWFEINPFDLVVCDANGRYVSPDSMCNTCRDKAKKLGFSWRSHALRHSFCTNFATYGNSDIKPAQMLMRHSSSRTTLDVYTHAEESENKKLLDDAIRTMLESCDSNLEKCDSETLKQFS